MLPRFFRSASRAAVPAETGCTAPARNGGDRREARTRRALRAAKVAACAVLAVTLTAVVGCRDTDALKEIIYDQNAEIIDYDNPNKFYINDSTAEQESNVVSSVEVSEEEPTSDQVQNLVVYSSEPNSEGFTAKQSIFSPTPDFTGIEASGTVFFYQSDSVDAIDHAVTPLPEEEEQTEEEPEQQQNSPTMSDDPAQTGDNAGTVVPNPTPDPEGGGPTEENPVEYPDGTDGFTSTEGVGQFKDPTLAFDITDRDSVPPSVESVAAFGDYAIAVQMIGGSGALAATDQATLDALTSAGVATTASVAWTDASGDPASLVNVRAIVDSGAKVIVVPDPDAYTAQLSTERYNYLTENGVQWISLRDFSNSVNIKANVDAIGDMLQNSSVAQYGATAAARADEYAAFHDRVVSGANGGLAADAVNGNRALQNGDDADGLGYSGNASVYTVLVDYWDAGATYSWSGLSFDPGVAYASAGCYTTPVSYYIQAGGAINNAAARTTGITTGEIPVLQFSQTESWSADMWQNATVENPLYGGVQSLLDSGVDRAGTTQLGQGLGSDAMPKIIATSGAIRDAILASSASATSLYHAYPFVGNDVTYGATGLTYATTYGETSLWSCIGSLATSGTVGDPNPVYPGGAIDADDVLVNPSGYFCDWTKGTVESFLESGWVAAYVSGTYDAAQWEQDVRDFYSWAWGISVDMNAITNR